MLLTFIEPKPENISSIDTKRIHYLFTIFSKTTPFFETNTTYIQPYLVADLHHPPKKKKKKKTQKP